MVNLQSLVHNSICMAYNHKGKWNRNCRFYKILGLMQGIEFMQVATEPCNTHAIWNHEISTVWQTT